MGYSMGSIGKKEKGYDFRTHTAQVRTFSLTLKELYPVLFVYLPYTGVLYLIFRIISRIVRHNEIL